MVDAGADPSGPASLADGLDPAVRKLDSLESGVDRPESQLSAVRRPEGAVARLGPRHGDRSEPVECSDEHLRRPLDLRRHRNPLAVRCDLERSPRRGPVVAGRTAAALEAAAPWRSGLQRHGRGDRCSAAATTASAIQRRARGGRRSRARRPAQRVLQLAHRLPALRRVLRQARPDHLLERGRRPRLQGRDRPRLLLQDRRHHARRALALEGALAGQHLVQHQAEREDVRALVGRLALDLLRRHVARRPRDRPSSVSVSSALVRREPSARAAWPGRSRAPSRPPSSPGCSRASGRGGRSPSGARARARPRSGRPAAGPRRRAAGPRSGLPSTYSITR